MKLSSSVIFGIALVSIGGVAGAQSDAPTFTVAPYVMFAGMSGTVAIEEFPAASVNRASPGPFSGLNAGPGLYLEARQGAWSFALNVSEVSLTQAIEPYPLVNNGDQTLDGTMTTKQTMMDAYLFRRISKAWEVTAGFNGHHVGTILNGTFSEVEGDEVLSEDVSENYPHAWLTPVVGARWTPVDGTRWRVTVFGDVGAWSGNNFTWQLLPSAGYVLNHTLEISAQYRMLYVEYSIGQPPTPTTHDEGYLQYRTTTYGPQVAVVLHF